MYLFINGCGYKIVNKDKAITFNIIKVNTTGEKRINYKLRNKLLSFNKIGNNPITISPKNIGDISHTSGAYKRPGGLHDIGNKLDSSLKP